MNPPHKYLGLEQPFGAYHIMECHTCAKRFRVPTTVTYALCPHCGRLGHIQTLHDTIPAIIEEPPYVQP